MYLSLAGSLANCSELCTDLGEKQSFPAQFPTGQTVQINTGHCCQQLRERELCVPGALSLFGAWFFWVFLVLYHFYITNNGLCFYLLLDLAELLGEKGLVTKGLSDDL